MSRRSRLHYTLTTIGYGASRMKARLPRSTCLLGDSLSFGAAVRYKLPSHTTSRQNQTPQPQSLGSVRAIAFRSWLPPIGPIKDSHLQSLRHARRNFRLRLRLSLQNTGALPTPVLSLNLVQRLGGSQVDDREIVLADLLRKSLAKAEMTTCIKIACKKDACLHCDACICTGTDEWR